MKKRKKEFTFDVGVIGLGFVGLTLATALAKCGLKVLGVEQRKDLVSLVNKGKANFVEPGLNQAIRKQVNIGNLTAKNKFDTFDKCKYFIIAVGTPLGYSGKPRLNIIKSATSIVANQINDGSTVIVRSTVEIGTTRNYVEKKLKKTKKKFFLAMCAERTIEGNALNELNKLPQIIGSEDKEARTRAAKLFKHLTDSIIFVNSYESAEIIKLIDNTYRDVQFAFANEVARLCDAVGVDAIEVINAGKKNYPRTNVALPGLVGGPCLIKDPYILRSSIKKFGIDLEITKAARFVNERQPIEIISNLINRFLNKKLKKKLNISLLGLAFKGQPTTNDLRGSSSLVILRELQYKFPNSTIRIFDPVVSVDILKTNFPECSVYENIYEATNGCDIVFIANNSKFFRHQDINKLISNLTINGFIFDFWNNFSEEKILKNNKKYIILENFQKKEKIKNL